ncbi:outer membrane transport energization protein ExbD (TC 2.C.1.1.1) [Andreprevotia lacus DSM 23236]|jgi:biopolymer transport protein ExbD|uniref:Outer membrane transport energization protein ExbD (TC 2.C.1.1.1) n=1 Tax=Andreprevotia lacus DSM 23236 TaxID=1121001 RepID=A0A1W1XW25_9NEIS|nr:biopolymer transporter ExbD [Andreprevotia lacus]SMC27751.1 outer membrane transport energization protein ExbD (TC 2.C.1.1.1) [Andreprevotia lacus DSM 23236]
MAFSSNDRDEVLAEINITPLVDVMLVLLVAFIVTAPLLNNVVPVQLPKTVATARPEQKPPLVLTVDAQGRWYKERQEVAPAALAQLVKPLLAADPALVVQVRADDSVRYGLVAKLLAEVGHAGVSHVAVVTEP